MKYITNYFKIYEKRLKLFKNIPQKKEKLKNKIQAIELTILKVENSLWKSGYTSLRVSILDFDAVEKVKLL